MTMLKLNASSSTLKTSLPILLALPFICFLQSPVHLQTDRPAGTSEGAPVTFRVIASEPRVCPQHGLELELELENISNRKIAALPNGLTYQVVVTGDGRGTSTVADLLRKPLSSELVTLSPGQSYRKTVRYPINRDNLPPGVYGIQLTYGQFVAPSSTFPDLFRGTIDSNVVLFQILECP